MGVLEEIRTKQDEILKRLQLLEGQLGKSNKPDTRLMTVNEMMEELGISRRTFQNIAPDMPFLFRVGRLIRARRCDFEAWKENSL